VSLPKDWATENGVSAGTTMEFYPEEDSLLLTPKSETERTRGSLDVTNLDGEELTRAVMTMYVSGFDIIELEANRITTDQRRAIREATQGLVGVEVLEETGESVVIQDLLDSSELSITNAVTRMRLIAQSMLEDAVRALVTNDADVARDVVERDEDVDRLWFVVSRIFRSTLRSPRAAEELGVTPSQLALAWLKAQGEDVIPIPGSRSSAHMRENLAAEDIRLAPETVTRLNAMMTPDQVAGARYGEAQQAEVDTEEFGEPGINAPA
jgi:phosphate uptake regulator